MSESFIARRLARAEAVHNVLRARATARTSATDTAREYRAFTRYLAAREAANRARVEERRKPA